MGGLDADVAYAYRKEVVDRFEVTKIKSSTPGGIASIVSLLTMSGIAAYAFYDLHCNRHAPLWALSSFFFTILGGVGGALWETFGNRNSLGAETVESLRRANVGLVMMSTLLTCLLASRVPWDDNLTRVLAFHGAALWLNSYLREYPKDESEAQKLGLAYTEVSKVVELSVVAKHLLELTAANRYPYWILLAGTGANAASFILPSFFPAAWGSSVFHFVNAASTLLLYLAVSTLPDPVATPDFLSKASQLAALTGVAAAVVIVLAIPINYNKARLNVNSFLWNAVYFLILFAGFDGPVPAELAAAGDPNAIALLPYRNTHPASAPLGIPSPTTVPIRQQLNYKAIKFLFRIVGWLDAHFPHARPKVAPRHKPRIRMDVTCEYYIPPLLSRVMAPLPMTVPLVLKNAVRDGSDIAWLTLHGHLAPMLRRMPNRLPANKPDYALAAERGCTHVIDLDWESAFDTNDFFLKYGGKAFFTLADRELTLRYLTLAQTEDLIPVSVGEDQYETARLAFLASTGMTTVAGYHLAGIHMLYDLVSVALFNAFDHNPDGTVHPFRAVLQLHFFNHTMVDLATTPHLMDRGAVFTQIWAYSHDGICKFVEDFFRNKVVFASEDDLDARTEVFGSAEEAPPSQLDWMRRYKKIYDNYAETTMHAIYGDDHQVAHDARVQAFYKQLNGSLQNRGLGGGLPDRYQQFTTRAGLVSFVSDAIFHVTVIHEMHGTKTPSYALNAQLMQVKVARDLGPPAREDYNSLLMISAATGRVVFPKLLRVNPLLIFNTLVDGASPLRVIFVQAFNTLLKDLTALERDLRNEYGPDDDMLRMIALPTDLETGAGY